MNNFACYHALHTKLKARQRAILNREDWDKMLAYQKLSQVTEFLKKKYGYKDLIVETHVEQVHRGELERILKRYAVIEIEKILYYFSGSYKNFLKLFLMPYEIHDLQLILRSIARGEDREEIKYHFIHSEKYTVINYEKLLTSRTIDEFVEHLKPTVYYDALKTLTQDDVTKRAFHMEMKLNIVWYKLLMEKAKLLNKQDKKLACQFVGLKTDAYNLEWIYRARKYYDISKEEILIYSLTYGHKLPFSRLKKLVYIKSLEEFKELVQKYIGFSAFKENQDELLGLNIESGLYKNMKSINRRYSIAMPLIYIDRLGIEINNLISLTEGIRYGLSKEEINKYLVYIS